MRTPLGALLLTLPCTLAACQLIWSYDDFKDRPGTGGAAGSGGASSSSSSTTTSTPSSTTTTTSSSSDGGTPCASGPPGMACTGACDQAALALHLDSIQADVKACASVIPPATTNPDCIVAKDGLSVACADCWAALGNCGFQTCTVQCGIGDVNGSGCNTCLAKNCDCAFLACSGLPRPASLDAGADASCD